MNPARWSCAVALLLAAVVTSNASSIRTTRRAIPQELYRDNVEPAKGGKVPEAAHMRIELNKLDAAGLESGEGVRMMEQLIDASPLLPERTSSSSYNPGYSPPLKLKPGYSPEPSYPGAPAYGPYDPEPSYAPPSSPYLPEPEYAAPVGPVLLEKRPYEVKAVQELPISVAQSYTGFDCRTVPYPDRHYADPEAGCQIYHFCHADGKQDTFECGYGTIFNEYLGTCDYKNNVHCGEHVAAPAIPHHKPEPYHQENLYDFGPFGYSK